MFVMKLLNSSRDVRSSLLECDFSEMKTGSSSSRYIISSAVSRFLSCGIPCGGKSDVVTVSTNEMSACRGSATAAARLRTREESIFAIGL